MPPRHANSLTLTIIGVVMMLALMAGVVLLTAKPVMAWLVITLMITVVGAVFGFWLTGRSQREKAKRKSTGSADLPAAEQDPAFYTIGADGELIPLDQDEIEDYDVEKLKNT